MLFITPHQGVSVRRLLLVTLFCIVLPCWAQPTNSDHGRRDNAQPVDDPDQCLLLGARQNNAQVTLGELRDWCFDGQQIQQFNHVESLRARMAMENHTRGNPFVITPHKRNYVMPFSYWSGRRWNDPTKDDDDLQPNEVTFQLSLKAPLKEALFDDATLWVAFTGTFYWQAYNRPLSAPFREINYEPEIFLSKPVDWQLGPIDSELLVAGFSHQSNGRDVPLSRSWNRLYVQYIFRTGNYFWSFKPWYRIPEQRKDDPMDAKGDDNPDIERFMGNFELSVSRPFRNHVAEITLRNNLRSENRGAVRANYSFPLNRRFKGLVQVFSGYGDSMINYDNYVNRVSVGILLTDIL